MPESNDKFHWQSQMTSLIFGDNENTSQTPVPGWRCSANIDSGTALMIYRRNLKTGIERNLAAQFPVTTGYLGSAGFRRLSLGLVNACPPSSPLFKVFAAGLPHFALNFEEFDEPLGEATSALATIDFFCATVTQPDQILPMNQRYYELYRSVAQLLDSPHISEYENSGLYQQPSLHPEHVARQNSVAGRLRSCAHADQLSVEFETAEQE